LVARREIDFQALFEAAPGLYLVRARSGPGSKTLRVAFLR